MSGHRVNFHKSCLVGLNVEAREVRATTQFLYCKVGEVPFKFLGFPVGENPRLSSTWRPIVNRLKDRLSSWRRKHLSTGGRITLINSVLANLPLYYFSFFKAPKKVIREMVQVQRNFLWGGVGEAKKVAWVRWSKLCLSKELAGLGIRNMEIFNISLLAKWKWRILAERECIWYKFLTQLYGADGVLKRSQY